jgi:predicted outer membrane repeat protein
MESGNHVLTESRELTSSIVTVTNFTMRSDGAMIVFGFTGSLTIRSRNAELRGITFSINNSMYAEFSTNYLQEVIFEDCNFHGVGIYMNNVDNATFLRCNFSDYYDNRGYYEGAITLYSVDIVSVIQSNFINNTGAIYFRPRSYYYYYHSPMSASLLVRRCKFVNNTSVYRGGSAIYVTGNSNSYYNYSVIVNQTTFIYNNASRGGGGAINFDGECASCTISESIFISNSAKYCGALSTGLLNFDDEFSNISVVDTAFYYNKAVSGNSIGGGAACINGASSTITNCTFVGNTAAGYGGAMLVEDSEITITDTVFSNNTAGLSGGALLTYAYPSDYTIISSIFTDNGAGDDGGAMFIGRTGSDVVVERSNFLQNHAADRGAAIAMLGSSVTIYHGTNIYYNTANIGHTISACSSEIHLPIVAVRRPDPTFFSCVAYDNDVRFSTLSFQELRSYQNVTLLVNDIIRDNEIYRNPVVKLSGTDNQQNQSINKKLHQTTIIVYISLSLSIILTVMFVLFGVIALVVYCKFRQGGLESKSKSQDPPYDQPESFYEDMLVNEGHDTKAIEMKTNVVYKRP